MGFLTSAVVVAIFAVCVSAIDAPCTYCKYCKHCDHCVNCEDCALDPDHAPNCNMCKYCKFCTMCKLCDTFCGEAGSEEGIMASVSSGIGSMLTAAAGFAQRTFGIDVDLSDVPDEKVLHAEIAQVERGHYMYYQDQLTDVGTPQFKEFTNHDQAFVIFYAPWCGYCNAAKWPFAHAATALPEIKFGAVDCTYNVDLCKEQGVEGYPTLKLFRKGVMYKPFDRDGMDVTKENLIAWLKDPDMVVPERQRPPPPPPAEFTPFMADGAKSVVQLGTDTFKAHVDSHPLTVVMFYAPWCGHCTRMKPAYSKAADELAAIPGAFAAVDCMFDKEICEEQHVNGFPAIKVFRNGVPEDYAGERTQEDLVAVFHEKKDEL